MLRFAGIEILNSHKVGSDTLEEEEEASDIRLERKGLDKLWWALNRRINDSFI